MVYMGNSFIPANRKPSFPAGTTLPGYVALIRNYLCLDELEIYKAKTADDQVITAILWRFTSAEPARQLLDLQQRWWNSLDLKYQIDLLPLEKYIYVYGLVEMTGGALESQSSYRRRITFPLDFALDVVSELCMAICRAANMDLQCCVHPALVWVDLNGKAIPLVVIEKYSSGILPQLSRNPVFFPHENGEKSALFMLGSLLYRLLGGIQIDAPKQVHDLPPLFKCNREVNRELSRLVHLCLSALDSGNPVQFDQVSDFLIGLKSARTHLQDAGDSKEQVKTKMVLDAKPVRRGLAAVAGMLKLKKLLVQEIIEPFNNPDKYLEFGLTVPNGILLFGPPGCGKTFIARQLAEELDFYYQEVIPSSVASSYVHGATKLIRQSFKRAERKAPSIVFIDEIDALVPARNRLMDFQQYKSEEVSEFLIQLNNCAEKNILVIGASNEPNKIDPASLRPGRFDKLIYVEPPDEEARTALLELYLENRPIVEGFGYRRLAKKLVGYSCSDLRLLVDEASRFAVNEDARYITELHFAKALKRIPSSIGPQELMQYRQFQGRG